MNIFFVFFASFFAALAADVLFFYAGYRFVQRHMLAEMSKQQPALPEVLYDSRGPLFDNTISGQDRIQTILNEFYQEGKAIRLEVNERGELERIEPDERTREPVGEADPSGTDSGVLHRGTVS